MPSLLPATGSSISAHAQISFYAPGRFQPPHILEVHFVHSTRDILEHCQPLHRCMKMTSHMMRYKALQVCHVQSEQMYLTAIMAPSYTLRCLYLNILLTSGSVAAYPLQRATVGGTDARQQDDHVYEKRGVVLLNDVQESSSSEVLIARFDSRQYTTASWPSQPTWSGYSTSAWWTPSDSWTTSFTGAASTTNIFQSASTYMTATSETSEPSIASSTSSSASSTTSSYIYSTTTSTTLSSSTPTASPSSSSTELPTAVTTSSSSSSTTTSKPTSTSAFNPTASDNVAVYYGQTDQTSDISLDLICADPNVDIVVLAFVTTFFSPGGWPTLNLGPECGPATSAQTATGASGLLDCVSYGFAAQITQCQAAGKKVMMSLGGAAGYSDTTIASASDAQALAQTLFDLFLEPGSNNTTLAIRPFGDVVLDGFDVGTYILTASSSSYLPHLKTNILIR